MSTPVITYREALPSDENEISSLDSSFTTTSYRRLSLDPSSFMPETPTETPIHKTFPDSDSEEEEKGEEKEKDKQNTRSLVAITNHTTIAGTITTSYQAWNKRLAILDIKVHPNQRGQGIGRGLIEQVMEMGRREYAAHHVWLEVSNINTPAIKMYEAVGFRIVGYDEWLYEGTESAGEWAIFMARQIDS